MKTFLTLSLGVLTSISLTACNSNYFWGSDDPSKQIISGETEEWYQAYQNCPQPISEEYFHKLHVENPYLQKDKIILQHPLTREVIICDAAAIAKDGVISKDVELCASEAMKEGFVKLTEKPRFTAKDMDTPTGEYPSRYLKHDDLTPRW